MNILTRLFLALIFSLLFMSSAHAQMQDRVMFSCEGGNKSCEKVDDDKNSKCYLELVDIQIAGQSVVFGKQFSADEKWLKNLKIQVKNVSSKSFVYVNLAFILIEGLHEEPVLPWKHFFVFSKGVASDRTAKTRVSDKVILKPSQEIELNYDGFPQLYKEWLGKAGEGTFKKSAFTIATVESENGEQEYSCLITHKK